MKIHRCLAFFALILLPGHAYAASIGVNFGSGVGTLAATDAAGVAPYAQTHYNNVTSTPTNLVLDDDIGTATTAMLTMTALNPYFGSIGAASNPSGPDEILNAEVTYVPVPSQRSGTSLSFTLTNIPYVSYSIIVYDLNNTASVQGVTLGSFTYYTSSPDPAGAGYVDGNSTTPFTYIQGTSTSSAAPTANADYVIFTGLSGPSQTFTDFYVSSGSGAAVGGFQIVGNVPEPSTWTLSALGGVGLVGLLLCRCRPTA